MLSALSTALALVELQPSGLFDVCCAPVVHAQTTQSAKVARTEGGDGSAEVNSYGSDDDVHVLYGLTSPLKCRFLLATRGTVSSSREQRDWVGAKELLESHATGTHHQRSCRWMLFTEGCKASLSFWPSTLDLESPGVATR